MRVPLPPRFHSLRQQAQKDTTEAYHALADFVAPKASHVHDYVGAFACSAGFGVDELCAEYLRDADDYHSILVKAVADRLAVAFPLICHQRHVVIRLGVPTVQSRLASHSWSCSMLALPMRDPCATRMPASLSTAAAPVKTNNPPVLSVCAATTPHESAECKLNDTM